MSVDFDPSDSYFTPIRGQLTSFGSQADGKAIKRNSVTFQGNAGAGWVTINSDEYHVRRKSGYIDIRQVDDDGDLVDWQTYFDYQTAGNTAFRATYTVKSGATETTYSNESVTMSEFDPYLSAGDGGFDGELPQNLFVQEIHAEFGEIGGWLLSSTTLTSDSGNVTFDSSVPSIALGATGYQTGTGFWVGKNGGAYKLYIGDATNKQMYWDGSALTAGGFTIGADYLRDAANSFGLASTISGGDDVRFWAGDTFANRATAPLQLYESGLIFAKDVILAKGALTGASGATGYGYAVNPLFLCHFDGTPVTQSDFKGSAIGHKGQVDTRTGGVIFPLGKFGKAIQFAEATTNKVSNPSAETTGNFVARGTATVTRDTLTYLFDATSYKVVLAAANDGIDLTTSALTNAVHMVTFWATGSALATLQVSLDGSTWNTITQLSSEPFLNDTWTWCGISIPAAQANGSTTCRIRNTASSGTFYIDAVQVEAKSTYPTPYCDGGLGGSSDTTVVNGHSWSGTADASNSVRVATTLSYASAGNFNYKQGTISFWYFERGYANAGFPTAIDIYYDANNDLRIHLGGYGGGLQPYASSTWGGTGGTAAYNTAVSGGWHHLAFTWSASANAVKIYIDGVLGNVTATYSPGTPGGVPTIYVGANNAGSNPINTKIDDLAILPIALTLNEIKSIYYSTAPLMLGVTNQEFRLSGAGLGDVFGNANGLFGRASDGTPSFGILNGTVNATTWGGASESFDSGDFMFGSNASGKSNLIFDASAGTLALRTATTKKIELQTDGDIFVGTDTSAASTTHLALFGASQTFDSNAGYEAGDILIGRSTASSASIIWDKSLGALYFCYGAITNLASPSNLVMGINSNGLRVVTGFATASSSLTVTSGNQAIDHAGTSFVIVGTASGNWSVQHIKIGFTVGHRLIIWNNSAYNVSFIRNNSGSPSAGYGKVYTLTGADVVPATGYCIMEFIYGNDTAGSEQWILLSVRPV